MQWASYSTQKPMQKSLLGNSCWCGRGWSLNLTLDLFLLGDSSPQGRLPPRSFTSRKHVQWDHEACSQLNSVIEWTVQADAMVNRMSIRTARLWAFQRARCHTPYHRSDESPWPWLWLARHERVQEGRGRQGRDPIDFTPTPITQLPHSTSSLAEFV